MKYSPLAGTGNWYKGCLHCHSTVSPDGMYEPEELKQLYKNNGYSFLALTDHDVFTHHSDMQEKDFIVWPAAEAAFKCTDPTAGDFDCKNFHSGAFLEDESRINETYADMEWISKEIGDKEIYFEKINEYLQEYINKGCFVTLNHPVWSRLSVEQMLKIKGPFAMEIFNSGCDYMDACDNGTSLVLWDELLRRGVKIWAIAGDDTHGTNTATKPWSKIPVTSGRFEGLQGWIKVKAENLSLKALSKSLKEGRFYASTGPEIFDFTVEDNKVSVKCSPVEKVRFITYEKRGRTEFGQNKGDLITEAAYTLSGTEKYVRVECVDKYGKIAWSNPIFLK